MSDATTIPSTVVEPQDPARGEVIRPGLVEGEPLVEEELLVEDVSIDGMCGVY